MKRRTNVSKKEGPIERGFATRKCREAQIRKVYFASDREVGIVIRRLDLTIFEQVT